MKAIITISLLFCANLLLGQSIKILDQGRKCSIRGMSIVNDRVAWISGSNGYVAETTDGGHSWKWQQVKGFEKSDFRDIEAFSATEAVIMSSGTPALIMKTNNGGATWKICFKKEEQAWFLDEMAFINDRHGFALGDPIDGKFMLLETTDGGNSWQVMDNLPEASTGEAAFAASGSGIASLPHGQLLFVTGGSKSRILIGRPGNTWASTDLPMAQGVSSKGAFALAMGGSHTVIVGGDYRKPMQKDSAECYYNSPYDKPDNLQLPASPTGYQSGVCYLGRSEFLSTGTSGSNLSTDGGKSWKKIDAESFNVCQQSKRGKLVLLAGDNGKIAILEYQSIIITLHLPFRLKL